MSPRVKLDEWEQLCEQMERFGERGEVTATDEQIHVDFGAAEIEISRDGTVETGMPLHDFSHAETIAVVFDHDAGTLTVDTESVSYTFRRPAR